MIVKVPKPAALSLICTLTLLAACAEPPNYAPVETVNQALEPDNGYYLRKKTPTTPNNKLDKIEQSSAAIKKGRHSLRNRHKTAKNEALMPNMSQAKISHPHPTNQTLQKEAVKPLKNNLVVPSNNKSQASKNLTLTTLTQQPIDYHKNKAIISNTNKASAKKLQDENPNKTTNSQATEKNKKSIISIDNKKVLKLNFQWPLHGKISRNFSQTDNKGILIKGKTGQAVHAAESGKAVYCGRGLTGFGNLAIIKHNETYLTAYANNSKLFVKEGEQVKKGQTIGQVGLTGLRSSSLHFEIRKNGRPINPLIALPKH